MARVDDCDNDNIDDCDNDNIDNHDNYDNYDNYNDKREKTYPIHVGWPLLSRITVKGFGPGGDDTRLRKVDFVKIYSD